MVKKILIIGKGELGTALNSVLNQNKNNKVTLWDKDPNLPSSDYLFLAVPTKSLQNVVSKCNQTQNKNALLVVLSKGLSSQGKPPFEFVEANWKGKTALISGPMIAEELIDNKFGAGLVSSKDEKTVDDLISLFSGTNLELRQTKDLIGLSWLGPLKNVYAIGLGIADGLDKGLNYRGKYVSQAVKEMAQIISDQGGRKETAFTLAGVGDLIATGFSLQSSNFKYGKLISQQKKPDFIPEGLTVLNGLKARSDRQYPLLNQIEKLIDKYSA